MNLPFQKFNLDQTQSQAWKRRIAAHSKLNIMAYQNLKKDNHRKICEKILVKFHIHFDCIIGYFFGRNRWRRRSNFVKRLPTISPPHKNSKALLNLFCYDSKNKPASCSSHNIFNFERQTEKLMFGLTLSILGGEENLPPSLLPFKIGLT